eukprot:CAMPEP_0184109496 /NCGR_PEP_ID=MMETSP0974-20121125/16920_1 /TAXON_ID=483370 /ORGANISM="non described non described, Strain CCMP2097" /LENGTH=40 /DNA_ID= /DNA_START= /DNA_END= /DNA_ORIENTATION=
MSASRSPSSNTSSAGAAPRSAAGRDLSAPELTTMMVEPLP